MFATGLDGYRERCAWKDENLGDGHTDSTLYVGDDNKGLVCTDERRTKIVWDWGQKINYADSHDEGKRFLERVAYSDDIADAAKRAVWEATES